MPDRELVTAVVLVGGRSRRMGRDKALLVPDPVDGRTLTQRVLDALQPVAAGALLSGRPLPGLDGVPAVIDTYSEAGPLAGITAALDAVTTPFAIVAACDMPSIAAPLARHLLDRVAASEHALAVLCRSERGLEPLLSAWRRDAAAHLHAAMAGGVRAIHEALQAIPHEVLEPHDWGRLDPAGASFVNWNTPADVPPR